MAAPPGSAPVPGTRKTEMVGDVKVVSWTTRDGGSVAMAIGPKK